jgi:hypothetical protein
MKPKNIFSVGILLILSCLLISPCLAWNISIDNIRPSSIVWNVSEKPGSITFVSYDGINLSSYDPNASLFVQSDLSSGTYHSIKVIAAGQPAIMTATTNVSAAEAVNSDVDKWFYLILILLCFFCGFAIHWFLFWIGSFIALYALAEYILKVQQITVNIVNLQFLIYGAMFILGLVLWVFRKKKGFR